MKLKLVAVFASVLLLATGAAMAMPGNAPEQAQADDNAQADDHAQNGTAAADGGDGADENDTDARHGQPSDVPGADAANGSQGPPVDMPAQVPDFVSDVHGIIGSHVGGAVDGAQSLGEQISDVTPDGDDAANETTPENATATATP
ncbi:hypothetical protein [Halosimplex sp. J119]